ncbi:PH domain-containing protein [Roseivirga sp. E12]|uniref:PH domain-containing protein n=1 Tax=Roseivirga sp. E12 TaxID=2819237 RepID=UPI001ABC729C|nr:PH domain-containing protein [Roseivirga sp. E12]MBO3699232.1 PH domain-containing protein [Roseivirga sp. E12]
MNETFQNLSVNPDELPSVKTADFNHIEKGYLKVSLISSGVFFLILLIGAFCLIFFNDDIEGTTMVYSITLGSIALLWLLNIIVTIKAFPKKQYAIRERDIIYTKGLLWWERTSIPFNRIQHAELKQGPVDRMFKLHSLKIFTAGGQSSDLVIPGLNEETASRLKEFVLGKTAMDGSDN